MPDVAEAVVLDRVNEFPPLLRPLIVTLSAPLKSIIGNPAVAAPEIDHEPTGDIMIDV